MTPHRRLTVELLEDRSTPALIGAPWPEPGSLTLSFVPDGTQFNGQTSGLFRTLDAVAPTAVWEGEILSAFDTWASETNIHLSVVADDGDPIGTLGLKQGDPRFGDIRIAAFPMASDVLAVANPYNPFVADTSVGDVYLNSAYPFHTGTAGSGYDLYSVMLHEAGHVFGLGHSPDPNSPMFENFHPNSAGPTPADVATIQSIYGAPSSGIIAQTNIDEGETTNATGVRPQLLSSSPSYVEHSYYEIEATLTAAAPTRTYVVQSANIGPGMTNVMTVTIAADKLDAPHFGLTVLDSNGNTLDSHVVVDADGNYQVQIAGVRSNAEYFIRVTSEGEIGAAGAGFDLTADFALDGKNLVPFVSNTLRANQMESLQTLQVLKSQQFHFVFSASDFNNPADTGARMTIENAQGQVVFAMTVGDGATRAGDVFLNTGEYTVRFTRAATAFTTPLFFHLAGLVTTDALSPADANGAGVVDTTLNPVSPPASGDLGAISFFWLPYSSPVPVAAAPPAVAPAFGSPDMLALPGLSGASIAAPVGGSTGGPVGGTSFVKVTAVLDGAVSPVYSVESEAQAALEIGEITVVSAQAIPAPRLIEGSIGKRIVKTDAPRFKGHVDLIAGFVPSNPSIARKPRETRVPVEDPLAVEVAALVALPVERRSSDKIDRVAGSCGLALGAVVYLARKPVGRSALGRIAVLGKQSIRRRVRV